MNNNKHIINHRLMNKQLKVDFSRHIIKSLEKSFSSIVMTTSFGQYSAVMLNLVYSLIPGITVINIKLKNESSNTARHREKLMRMFDYKYEITEDIGDITKAELFRKLIKEKKPNALLSGVLWEETKTRRGFEYIMHDRNLAIYRVHPLLHWREKDLSDYLCDYGLPENKGHTDSYKEKSPALECGIHNFVNGDGI